ncbi:MAG: hypothetical protein QOF33_218 [Thermomicrobiales bacterium]|jgi:hypothetical protein|nr:hypothetical protein [Thermomicrobiales bacterium]MEA2582133.1 hypothetical protein [Thermomicrobiales bacterium]MEA2595444.1 hypothetical protein [Thermomicrobiales bacterium]
MDRDATEITDTRRLAVCPNCGNRQTIDAVDARCDRCGSQLVSTAYDTQEFGSTLPQQADPITVAPPTVSGGIGDLPDGTQVTHRVPTPVPGKPMAPIADTPVGNDDITPVADPGPGPHVERGEAG